MRILILAIIAWVTGAAAYFAAFLLTYDEPLSWSGDTKAVLFWSAAAFGIALPALYLPLLHAIRRLIQGVEPAWPFPLTAVAIGVIPVALIAFVNGGDLRSLWSQEAFLFYTLFAAIGLVLGIGFTVIYGNDGMPDLDTR